jgi:hypothetical protein
VVAGRGRTGGGREGKGRVHGPQPTRDRRFWELGARRHLAKGFP